jgi:acetyl-CoA acetyltransferase
MMPDWAKLRDKTAIVGIGYTKFTKNSGMSTLGLAVEAGTKAIADAGLRVSNIDGIATYAVGDSAPSHLVAETLGIRDPHYFLDHFGGGSVCQSTVVAAMMAVYSGMADYVLCYRALNTRSGFRMGGTGRSSATAGEAQYLSPYGHMAPSRGIAMACRLYMHKYGLTSDQLGEIAVTFRKHASMNERAMLRNEITLEDYRASRIISDPLRLFDCCLESDGACALVVTSAERARDLPQRPIYIMAGGYGPGRTIHSTDWDDLLESGGTYLAPRLYQMAGIGPQDLDAAMLYDAFTYMVVVQLEDYGFCQKGEGGAFAAGGRLRWDSAFPVNTHGGHLSEAYIHGYNHIIEAVEQLRGQSGERQLKEPEIVLVTGAPGGAGIGVPPQCNALILRR